MGQRMLRGAGLVGAAVGAVFIAGAIPAAAADAPGNSEAHAIKANVKLLKQDLVKTGPTPEVHGKGGPNSDSVVDLSALGVPPGALTADTLKATADRDTSSGESSSSATVQNVTLPALKPVAGAVPTLDVIKSECTATEPGKKPELGTTIADADLGALGDVDVSNISPNTTVKLPGVNGDLLNLTLNEQIDNGDGSWTVNAVHLTVAGGAVGNLASADVVLSSSTCGPAAEGGGTTPPSTGNNPPGDNGNGNGGGGASQVSKIPQGAADTGGGSTAGVEDPWLFGLGGALVLSAGGALALRRRLRVSGPGVTAGDERVR